MNSEPDQRASLDPNVRVRLKATILRLREIRVVAAIAHGTALRSASLLDELGDSFEVSMESLRKDLDSMVSVELNQATALLNDDLPLAATCSEVAIVLDERIDRAITSMDECLDDDET